MVLTEVAPRHLKLHTSRPSPPHARWLHAFLNLLSHLLTTFAFQIQSVLCANWPLGARRALTEVSNRRKRMDRQFTYTRDYFMKFTLRVGNVPQTHLYFTVPESLP
ncbi:hypothetical protein EDB87DRAFT_680980 [Lactarius vividus]|nr:hypothetical protein EDB87DRAFT_680980 [Lactarius vividus]